MPRAISGWIAIASTQKCGPTLQKSPSAIRASASIALISTLGPRLYISQRASQSMQRRQIMGRKKVPGLLRRGNVWHVDKVLFGRRICQSTGSAQLAEAERMLAKTVEETRLAQQFGIRPARTF